jgi:DNA-directed RNA polymerase
MTVQYTGGYFLHDEPLVRGYGGNAHTAADLSNLSNYSVNAVNYIQETAWAVNPMILTVSQGLQALNEDIVVGDETVLRFVEPIDPRRDPNCAEWQKLPKARWQAMTADERLDYKNARVQVLEQFKSNMSEVRATNKIIHSAVTMCEFDHFYFPHNMDFRTRIYPIPAYMTPQSDDLSKGLLRFARPTKLGTEGVFWMGFAVATHWGEDKLSPEDRHKFAVDFLLGDTFQAIVDDPIANREWLEADKPFQFLAVLHEWVWANRMDDPEEFLSHLPGNLDGSCNGAQHLSIMARDLVGAEATNCRNIKARRDLYMEVAERVWEQTQEDCLNAHPMALKWRSKMEKPSARRKVVKRAVMTVPYGVTERGVTEFMISDKHVDKGRDQWDQAKYMRTLIMAAVDVTLNRGKALQAYFMDCATICAENGKPLVWDTPAGSKVTQAYRNMIQKRIKSFDSVFYVYEEPTDEEEDDDFYARVGFDVSKMATAAPPNVVHSCDASHLQITTCRMHDYGIRDFSMIHDSFGCPFAHVGIMRDILRQSAVDMYKGDYLQEWKASVERYSGLEMPEPPTMGDFDITEILDSEFFFS